MSIRNQVGHYIEYCAEIIDGMVRDVTLDAVPITAVIADALATGADGQQSAQGLDLLGDLEQFQFEAMAAADFPADEQAAGHKKNRGERAAKTE